MTDTPNNKPQVSLQAYMRSQNVQERLEALLQDRAPQFTTSLMSLINSNPVLQECKPESVFAAAITAAAMDLPINPNLGFAYIIPYKNKKKIKEEYVDGQGVTKTRDKYIYVYEAQFQMGWKGFVQLAQRSNTYRLINSTDVRQTEYKGENHLTGEYDIKWVKNEERRVKLPIIGYLAFFRLHNGFEKALYMTVEDLQAHAKQYSKAYASGYGMWVDGFDKMAKKTVLKLLISGYGQMSTQMQKAILADQASLEEDSYNYVDNDKDTKPDEAAKAPAAEPTTTADETNQDNAE